MKNIRLMITISTLTTITIGYDALYPSSGIYLKFIPYQPAIRVRGMKIDVITVRIVIILFCFTSSLD